MIEEERERKRERGRRRGREGEREKGREYLSDGTIPDDDTLDGLH